MGPVLKSGALAFLLLLLLWGQQVLTLRVYICMARIAILTPHAPRLLNSPAVRRRFGLALCASAMTHAWLLTALPPAQRPQVRPSFTINARIEARETGEMRPDSQIARNIGPSLAPFLTRLAPSLDLSLESIPVLEAAPTAREGKRAAPVISNIQREKNATATRATEPSAGALPQPVDSTWYAAHELDSYPRALAPIKLDYSGVGGSGNAGARLLLWLRIDEHGQVVEVSAGEAAIPGHWVEAARASLRSIQFTPARKDERAVKSRLLLGIDLARGGEERGTVP